MLVLKDGFDNQRNSSPPSCVSREVARAMDHAAGEVGVDQHGGTFVATHLTALDK